MEYQANESGILIQKNTIQVNEPERALLQTVHVEGIGPVKTLIDSGNSSSSISLDLLTDSIISKIDDPEMKNWKLAILNPSKTLYLGSIELDVRYLGRTVKKMYFYVYNKMNVPMILGANWIRKSHTILQSDGTKLQASLSGKRKWFTKQSYSGDGLFYFPSAAQVPVELDEPIGSVRAQITTGLSQSIIRRELLTDLQLSQVIPTSDTTILSPYWQVSNKRFKVEGLVSLNVTIQGMTTCVENVRVVSEMDFPSIVLVLGMDWINKSRVVIRAKGSKITVSPPTIHYQKCTNSYTRFD